MSFSLQTSEGRVIDVGSDVFMQMTVLKKMAESGNELGVVPLPFESNILDKIIDYCGKHLNHGAEENMEEWNKRFFDLPPKTIAEIIKATRFLGVNDLYGLACQAYADLGKGKTAAELRIIYS